jgi:flagellar biosynthesis anti-sigma factor FlgM
MRIAHPNSPGNAAPAPTAETAAPQPAARPHGDAAPGPPAVSSDRAELSGVAGRLSEILHADAAGRAERVRQLKETVASGTYQVDAAAVSRALVDEAIEPK